MARMSSSEYDHAKKFITEYFNYGRGSKAEYESYMARIERPYDDGRECARRLDEYQSKYKIY